MLNYIFILYPHFRQSTAYQDVELTGLDGYSNTITTVVLSDGHAIFQYVNGEKRDDIKEDIARCRGHCDLLCKYLGIPLIGNYLRISMYQTHIDLRYIQKNPGYSGGSKRCDRQMGLERGGGDGVDGYFAVLLWEKDRSTGNRQTLETFLAYNYQDAVNLEILRVEPLTVGPLSPGSDTGRTRYHRPSRHRRFPDVCISGLR